MAATPQDIPVVEVTGGTITITHDAATVDYFSQDYTAWLLGRKNAGNSAAAALSSYSVALTAGAGTVPTTPDAGTIVQVSAANSPMGTFSISGGTRVDGAHVGTCTGVITAVFDNGETKVTPFIVVTQ
jgi:hypothetical protein